MLPALLGGGVFAFSSYGLAESVNHLNLALVFCVPLAALVGVRHARGTLSDNGAALRIAALVVVQLTIFTEVLATAALFGLGTIALLRLWRTGLVALAGLALGALIASPYLYVAFAHPNPLQQGTGPLRYPMDLANLWTPTRVTALGNEPVRGRRRADGRRRDGADRLLRRRPARRWSSCSRSCSAAPASAGCCRRCSPGVLLCALGSHITLHGVERWRGPWLLVSKLPLLHLALPSRFPMYAWLAVAVMCALLVARASRPASRGRWCCSRCCRSCRPGRPTCGRRRCRCRALFADGTRAVGDPRPTAP